MNILQRIEVWGDNHHPKWLDFIRIILGIFLIYKGIDFLRNMGTLMGLMPVNVEFNSLMFIVLGHYVVFAHIVGGLLMTIGLFTRFASLIQIPVLLAAVILVNLRGDIMRPYSELFLSIIVLILLIYFLIVGNGPLSYKLADEEKRPNRERLPE
ncbi:MAG: DoxX family protein [Ferruginibacter sp.]|nr:DoxX family protein [Ferruginibacter sp.]